MGRELVRMLTFSLAISILALLGFALTLVRHLLFKRELKQLKEDMKNHILEHGMDNTVWEMFTERTRKMLRF